MSSTAEKAPEAPKIAPEALPNVRSVETMKGETRELNGAIPEENGIVASIKFGKEVGNELKIIDMNALDIIDDDGESVLVSVLGEDKVISKDTRFLVIGQGKEMDANGFPALVQLEVKEGDTKLGRKASPDFMFGNNVSKEHATIKVDSDGKLELTDHSINGSTLEYTQTPEAAAEAAVKKDGEAILKASGVVPPVVPRTTVATGDGMPKPSVVTSPEAIPGRDMNALLASTTTGKLYERMSNREKAIELRNARANDEEALRPTLVSQKAENKEALRQAKHDRRSVRWENGRIGLLAERASLRKELHQSARDSGASLLKRASMYRKSYGVARKQVAKEASVKLSNAETAVLNARRAYYGKKNELGALNFRSKHGGRNTLRENKAIIRGAKRSGTEYVGSLFDTTTPESAKARAERLDAQLKAMGRSKKTAVPSRHSRNANRAKSLKADSRK